MTASTLWRTTVPLTAVAFLCLLTSVPAAAQVSTSTIQGTVSDATGVLPGATVTAKEVSSGFTQETVSGSDGAFALAGLRPGRYEITVAVSQYKPQAKTVEILVGQTVTANFRITADVVYTEAVSVVGDTRLVDTRKPEVTTNVTREQLRYLPQNSRNFLNFAALAPGVRVSDNEFRKEFSAGALPSQNVNVFIDGVSFKNDVIDGGVVGQDASRGNPFPQSAVQEFQVLTQNFKAEYEKAASAIITTVTRSGGNRYTGELFNYYQDKGLVDNEAIVRDAQGLFVKGETTPKPTYERFQFGGALGGPIVKDRMQFFGSYEENWQDRAGTVIVGSVSSAPASLVSRLRAYEGVFTSPFREKLLFGKVSAQPSAGQRVEVTYNWRNESDIRGFGGQGGSNSFETAENVKNRVDSLQGKWQVARSHFLNEAYLSYQRYRWNPRPENPGIIGENFEGLLRIGGRDTEQFIVQQRVSLRNDFSRFLKWRGEHTAKVGGIVSFLDYDVSKRFNGNPLFTYRGDISWDFPARANFGSGNPDLNARNYQFGFFLQDDWALNSRLTLNLGLRWDYESDMLNNDYVTPTAVRDATAPFVDNARYFTDGDDRPAFFDAWQPRLGFSFDLTGKGQTIAFGGWGRYYDRVLYNSTLDERFRLQYARADVSVLAERRHSRRRRDDSLATVLSERRRPRIDHRPGPGAEPRGVPDCQRRAAAALGSVVARRAADLQGRHHLGNVQRHAQPRSVHLHSWQPAARRHVLPDGARLLEHPHLRSRWPQGLVRRPVRPDRSTVRRRWVAIRLQPHLHARAVRADRRRSLQPRFPDRCRLSALPDQHRRAPPARPDRHRPAALGLSREHVHHARIGHTVHDRRPVAGRRRERAAVDAQRGQAGAIHLHHSGRVGVSIRRPAGREDVPFPRPQPDRVHLPGLQHLQLRQLLRLSGLHPDAALGEHQLRPAEQPARSGRTAAVWCEVWVLRVRG